MKKTLTVKVLQKHIKNGLPEDIHFCPVALAAKAAGIKFVSVGGGFLAEGRSVDHWPYPKKVNTFIKRFDSGKSVKPFNFEVSYEGSVIDAS